MQDISWLTVLAVSKLLHITRYTPSAAYTVAMSGRS